MKIREISESFATTSGAVAAIAMPMGMQTRAGDSLLAGKYSTDSTPNTPKEYKRNKHVSRRFKNTPGN